MRNCTQVYIVMSAHFYTNPSILQSQITPLTQNFQAKEFSKYEEAETYIDDMLKHHDTQFQIHKVYKQEISRW